MVRYRPLFICMFMSISLGNTRKVNAFLGLSIGRGGLKKEAIRRDNILNIKFMSGPQCQIFILNYNTSLCPCLIIFRKLLSFLNAWQICICVKYIVRLTISVYYLFFIRKILFFSVLTYCVYAQCFRIAVGYDLLGHKSCLCDVGIYTGFTRNTFCIAIAACRY